MSSASSTTDDWDCVRAAAAADDCVRLTDEDVVDDWDACESRRPIEERVGAFSVGWSGIVDEMSEVLLKLPCRPIEPTPGVWRSGIGGGPPIGAGRGPAGAGRGPSSVGLPPKLPLRDDIEEVRPPCSRPTGGGIPPGRHTF